MSYSRDPDKQDERLQVQKPAERAYFVKVGEIDKCEIRVV